MPIFNQTPLIIKETARGLQSVRIEDELLKSREIFLVEPVTSDSMNSLMKQLMFLNKEDPDKEITLYINSPGGEVTSGLAVYDYMKMMKAPIRTVCTGMAASMGSILFLAGDKREMLPHTEIMIHDPSYGNASMSGAKPAEIAEHLTALKKTQKVLCEIIAEATGKSLKSVRSKTRRDSFFKAEEALEFGLATRIIDSLEE